MTSSSFCISLLALSTAAALLARTTSAFGFALTRGGGGGGASLSPPLSSPFVVQRTSRSTTTTEATTTTSRRALIFGWDGEDDTLETGGDGGTSSYVTADSDLDSQGCSPLGTAVAESLSYDRDRVGSLARLAVAFAPPDQALTLDQIENVDVLCVGRDHIDIQAIICEDGGCVSVAVPVRFPFSCGEHDEWMEGCVRDNLDRLDEGARTALLRSSEAEGDGGSSGGSDGDMDDLCLLDASDVAFPSWWVPPGCDASMSDECTSMRSILNDSEFEADIIALATDSLRMAGELAGEGYGYDVREAKVAAIGPAGLCFKVRAASTVDGRLHVLDVLYPFGENVDSVEKLRAAVLGAVATA